MMKKKSKLIIALAALAVILLGILVFFSNSELFQGFIFRRATPEFVVLEKTEFKIDKDLIVPIETTPTYSAKLSNASPEAGTHTASPSDTVAIYDLCATEDQLVIEELEFTINVQVNMNLNNNLITLNADNLGPAGTTHIRTEPFSGANDLITYPIEAQTIIEGARGLILPNSCRRYSMVINTNTLVNGLRGTRGTLQVLLNNVKTREDAVYSGNSKLPIRANLLEY